MRTSDATKRKADPERYREHGRKYRLSEKGRATVRRYLASEKARNARREQSRRRREQGKALIDKIKSVPCMDCGGTFPPVCMDFDHRPESEKHFDVSRKLVIAADRLLAEVAKCDIVCANCHRIRTQCRAKAVQP